MLAKIPALFLLLLIFSCSPQPFEQTFASKAPQEVKHPRVIWTENPSEHAIISWTTGFETEESHVEYDTMAHGLRGIPYPFKVNVSLKGEIGMEKEDFKSEVPPGYFNHAELNGLKPSTRYYFRVCSGGHCSEEFYFITAPKSGTNFSLIAGGDSRLGKASYAGDSPHTDRQLMNNLIAKIIEDDQSVMAFVHGADFCSTAEWRHLYWWFEDLKFFYTRDKRILPLLISRGNHDMEYGFTQNFWLGDISRKNIDGYYYSTIFSDQVALITLNTEISMAGDQLEWLRSQLIKLRPKYKWLILNYHKPAFPAVKEFSREDFSRVRKYWVPLFEEYRIDLSIESDGHALKKTHPIRDGAYHPDGIIYIGEGGLGVPQRKADPERWYFQNGGLATEAHHVWKLDFKKDRLKVSAIGLDMQLLHEFDLEPHK